FGESAGAGPAARSRASAARSRRVMSGGLVSRTGARRPPRGGSGAAGGTPERARTPAGLLQPAQPGVAVRAGDGQLVVAVELELQLTLGLGEGAGLVLVVAGLQFERVAV